MLILLFHDSWLSFSVQSAFVSHTRKKIYGDWAVGDLCFLLVGVYPAKFGLHGQDLPVVTVINKASCLQ